MGRAFKVVLRARCRAEPRLGRRLPACGSRKNLRWLAVAIREDKQTPPRLRHPKLRCIKHLGSDTVTETAQITEELADPPQFRICTTFSSTIHRGPSARAKLNTYVEVRRLSSERGLAPLAGLWCVHSGEARSRSMSPRRNRGGG